MSGCVYLYPFALTYPQAADKTPPVAPNYFECDSAQDAVSEVVRRENPRALVLSESHPSVANSRLTTMLEYFAENMLKALSESGFKALILEGLYSDVAVDKTIAEYLSGEIDIEKLLEYIYPKASFNTPGIVKTLKTARRIAAESQNRNKVDVLGGSVRTTDAEAPHISNSMLAVQGTRQYFDLMRRVAQRIAEKANIILVHPELRDVKIVVYTGFLHSDSRNPFAKKGLSLSEHLTTSYTEVKLVPAEVLSSRLAQLYPEFKLWRDQLSLVPRSGKVTLIKTGNSYAIIFPKGVFASSVK